MRREFKWVGLGVVALAVVAFGCESTTDPPPPPPDPPQIRLDRIVASGPNGLLDDDVYDIFVDSQDQLWIATNTGLWLNDATDTVRTFNDRDGIPNRQIRSITELNGDIIVGTWGGGLGVYDGTSWRALSTADGLTNNLVYSLAVDDSSVWIGTVDGVSQYIPSAQRWITHSARLSSSRIVKAVNVPPLLESNPRRGPEVWMGTIGDGAVSLRIPAMYAMYGFETTADGLEVFAAGAAGSIMLFRDRSGQGRGPNTWDAMGSGTRKRLSALWGAGPNAVHVVGEDGTARFFNGTSWVSRNSRTTEDLNAIWGTSGGNIWAVGDNGTAIRFNSSTSTWFVAETPTDEDLLAVWGASPTQFYAVGENGTVIQNNGSQWRAVTDIPQQTASTTMLGMWGASDNAIFSVGMTGAIMMRSSAVPRDRGGSGWAFMPSPTSNDLRSVFGNSAGDVYAVGTNGTVLGFNGGAWAALPSLPPDYQVNAVWARNETDIFVAGELTTYANSADRFYRWDGSAWAPSRRGADQFRQSVSFSRGSTGIPGDDVSDIAYDPSRDLFWITLEDFGMASVDVDGARWTSYSQANGLVSNVGFSVDVNTLGDVWFAGQDGASCILGSSGGITSYPQGSGLPTVRIRRVYVAPNAAEDVWMGFINKGAGRVISNQRP